MTARRAPHRQARRHRRRPDRRLVRARAEGGRARSARSSASAAAAPISTTRANARHHRPRRAARRRLDARARRRRPRAARRRRSRSIRALFAAMAPRLGPHTIVTDAGSTKQDVIAAARATLGDALPRFVPGHPIAGTEHSGRRGRVRDALPRAQRRADAAARDRSAARRDASPRPVGGLRRAGARRSIAAAHDRIFAAVSHLPHLLAFALVDELAARPDADELFRFAASGFRDFTRIAASSPEMWRDISLANRDALLARDRRVPRAARPRSRRWSPPATARRSKRCSRARAPRAARGMRAATRPAVACRTTDRASA